MQPESTDQPIVDPVVNTNQPTLTDSSSSMEELSAHIDQELGIKTATPEAPKEDPVVEESAVEEPEPEEPEQPVIEAKKEEPKEPSDAEIFIEVEDASGTKYKISAINDLPRDFQPKDNLQVIEILKDLQGLDQRIADRKIQETNAEQEAVAESQRQEIMSSWDREIDNLQKEGRLDKAKLTSDNPKYSEDPAVKKADAVFKFMESENTKRREAGITNMLTSFEDAFDKYELLESKKATEEQKKTDNNIAKEKASLLGGKSATAEGERYVYRSGSAKSIWDLP